MNLATTQIKIYGPGISEGLQKLDELEKNKDLRPRIKYSGIHIGEEADYEILWNEVPTPEESLDLVKYFDEIFTECNCRYTVSTNNPKAKDVIAQIEASKNQDIAFTFIRLIGPSISKAIEILNENISDLVGVKSITGELIGRYDYTFEWIRIPLTDDILRLSEKTDQILKDTGVIFTFSTKSKTRIITIPQIERDRSVTNPIQFVLPRVI